MSPDPSPSRATYARRRLLAVCVVLAAVWLLVGAAAAVMGPSGEAALATPPAPAPPAAPVTVAVAGDVHAEPPIDGVLASGGSPFVEVAELLSAADLAVVNVETAVGETGSPAGKTFTFQAPEALWPALVEAGVDVVSLANNHALDYGVDGLLETLAGARAAGLRVVGAGRDAAEAYAPAIVDVRGARVAVVGLSRLLPTLAWAAEPDSPGLASAYDVAAAVAAVRAAAARADHVVVTVHWGDELARCPDAEQLELADALAAAGADLIAGHHPHVLQGIADVRGATVAYSLGNFVFYAEREVARQTGVLTATLSGRRASGAIEHEFAPARIDDEGVPRLLRGEPAQAVLDAIADQSPGGDACGFA